MWIRVATPVTKRMNAIDNGSARNPNSTLRPPDGNQVKRSTTCCRCWGARSRSAKNITTEVANASANIRLPIHPAIGSPIRFPNSMRKNAPNSGNAGTNQSRSRTSCAFTARSALQHPQVVGRRTSAAAEDRDDDREADGHLRRGDDQREEHEHLSAHVV